MGKYSTRYYSNQAYRILQPRCHRGTKTGSLLGDSNRTIYKPWVVPTDLVQQPISQVCLLLRLNERPSAAKHNQPILAHKLLDRSPDRISAYAVLVGQLKLARRQLASGGYGVI